MENWLYIKEDMGFRLGGKAQKGYTQEELKTFDELDQEDYLFRWEFKNDKLVAKEQWQLEGITYVTGVAFKFYGFNVLNSVTVYGKRELSAKAIDKSVYAAKSIDPSIIYVYSTYDMSENEAYKAAQDFFESEMDESVDFRLGGKKQSGYDQEAHKTFNELKPGDPMWWVKIRRDGKHDMHIEKEWQREFNKIDYTMRDPDALILDSTERCRLRCFVDELDKTMAASCQSPYSSETLYLMTTYKPDIDDIKKKVNSFDGFRMDESTDFRLGGSANKGEDTGKSFNDLRAGDTIYEYRFEDIRKPNYTLEEYEWEIFEIEKVDIFHTCFHGERIVNGEYKYSTLYVNNKDMDEPITMYEQEDRYSRSFHDYDVAITTYEADVERIRQTLIETFLKH